MKSLGEPKKKPKKKGKKAGDDSLEAVHTPPAPTMDVLQDADTAVGNNKEEVPQADEGGLGFAGFGGFMLGGGSKKLEIS